ncbi:hypothetical protein [Candidatus Uabimicrobium sp. HlEnr_7]|uniref:hypothetical protein n=1 Tax=Candidatus Uabimicrobium helgolandensis TaxID=3095367 RepID=UPI0035576CD6
MKHLIMLILCSFIVAETNDKEKIQNFLTEGKYVQGEAYLQDLLSKDAKNDNARFGLAALQVFKAFTTFSDRLYEHGLRNRYLAREFRQDFMLPFEVNPNAKETTYKDLRGIVEDWKHTLEQADMNLQKIKSNDMQLEINLSEAMFGFFANLNINLPQNELESMKKQTPEIVIHFDASDAHWLRGYCNIFMALGEVFLAYDHEELFNAVGHLFFSKVKADYKLLGEYKVDYSFSRDLVDVIALIHGFSFEVKEPQRMLKALYHLETFVAEGKLTWEHILKEQDTDHFEWVPNPKQKSFMTVEQKNIDDWLEVLTEIEGILKGKKLVPFWINRKYGINIRKLFTEPGKMDLIMWIHGSGVVRYVEEGVISDGERWNELSQRFGGDFFTYMFWFN